jgi:lycopene beta-cyclase
MLRSDVLILGGGCAGLSLATALAPRGLRITVLEQRKEYVRDRTWCFWDLQPHRFGAAVTHQWPRWAVRHGGREVVRSAPGLRYVHVDGGRFYELALAALRAAPNVELRLGTEVRAAREVLDGAVVTTEAGELSAPIVYDTRPRPFTAPPAPSELRLLQHFRGAFVRTPKPVFEASTAMLMDFDVPQDRGLAFMYVLPFAPDRALVEATWFSESVHDAHVYEAAMERWREERLGLSEWQVLETERGVLPMTTEPLASPRGARIQRLGAFGGAAKPSTGYAFQAIQRQVDALAARFALGNRATHAPPPARGQAELAMDRIMLDWMRRNPAAAPGLFLRLFERAPGATMARFLSEQATGRERLHVMGLVPTLSFTAATLRSALGTVSTLSTFRWNRA